MNQAAIFVAEGSGQRFEVIGGDVITFKATGADTNGAYTVLETVVPPNSGPPKHLHRRESESFYVVEGDFEFQVGDETINAGPGSFLIAPSNLAHCFRNRSSTPGKLIIVCQPAGFEDFVKEFATIPTNAQPAPRQMAELGARYVIKFIPPENP